MAATARSRASSASTVATSSRPAISSARACVPYPTLRAPAAWAQSLPAAPPEVIVREHPARPRAFTIELLEPRRLGLAVSASYEHVDARDIAPDERPGIEAQIAQARSFLRRLDLARTTIRAVAELVVARQHEFVIHGPRALVRH